MVDPLIHALIGDPIEYAPKIRIRSRKYTNLLDNYRLVHDVWLSDGSRLRRRLPEMNLAEGWNLFTFEEESQLRTLLVFGDITPPEFVLSTSVPTVINPLDLKRGFRVTGTILDNSFGSKHFKKVFKGHELLALPIFTREDGSSYVVLEFTVRDFADNTTPVSFELTLDEAEPLFHVKQRVVNPPRVVVSALMYLLGFGDES